MRRWLRRGMTSRGFDIITFADRYGAKCNIQKSSLANEDAIWFGVENADPKILSSKVRFGGTGWERYEIPDHVLLNTRMHLTRMQILRLLPTLIKFVLIGTI
ncbi:MAG: hypothetical protein WC373_08530 [Smithella sp.]|jgi:hypothetical protein